MIKRTLTFEDLEGNPRTQDFFFNLTKPELIELELSMPGGLSGNWNRILEKKDNAGLLKSFKDIMLAGYGEKADDGIRFLKFDPVTGRRLSEGFLQTDAYAVLFMELLGPEATAETFSDFVLGMLPKEIQEEARKNGLTSEAIQALAEQEGLTAPLPQSTETAQPGPDVKKKWDQYTRDELLAMSDDDFDAVAGTKPLEWPQPLMQIAWQRKAQKDAQSGG